MRKASPQLAAIVKRVLQLRRKFITDCLVDCGEPSLSTTTIVTWQAGKGSCVARAASKRRRPSGRLYVGMQTAIFVCTSDCPIELCLSLVIGILKDSYVVYHFCKHAIASCLSDFAGNGRKLSHPPSKSSRLMRTDCSMDHDERAS